MKLAPGTRLAVKQYCRRRLDQGSIGECVLYGALVQHLCDGLETTFEASNSEDIMWSKASIVSNLPFEKVTVGAAVSRYVLMLIILLQLDPPRPAARQPKPEIVVVKPVAYVGSCIDQAPQLWEWQSRKPRLWEL